jgi:hypothetical protein
MSMSREERLIEAGLRACEHGLAALEFVMDRLLAATKGRDEMDMLQAVHDAGKGVFEAKEALEVVAGVLKELERGFKVERVRGDKR